MRKLLLIALLYTGFAQAQYEHISVGYGKMDFPSIELSGNSGAVHAADPSKGHMAYLAIGAEDYGGMLLMGADSRITYGGGRYSSGMIGLAGFRDIEIYPWLKVGLFAGVLGFQTKQGGGNAGNRRDHNGTALPSIKTTNVQPYGGVRVSVSFVEIQYAPAGNSLTIGFVLR